MLVALEVEQAWETEMCPLMLVVQQAWEVVVVVDPLVLVVWEVASGKSSGADCLAAMAWGVTKLKKHLTILTEFFQAS